MNFKNSSSYVQRQIDNMFYSHRQYVRAYVNDIMIFNKILKKHVQHLHAIFNLLNFKEIMLSFKKSFLNYSIVILLRQKIDVFDFIVAADKIIAIQKLNFSYTLTNLKLYLKLTKYFRNYVFYYIQKANVLQRRKMILLRMFLFNKKRVRKIYSQKIILKSSISEKLKFYRQLRDFFNKINFLIHFDRDRTLYININASKRCKFDVMIYHLKINVNFEKFRVIDIELILFLNRFLNSIETRY